MERRSGAYTSEVLVPTWLRQRSCATPKLAENATERLRHSSAGATRHS